MSAQCGPLNPLQKLSNHSQHDRSIHQDHQHQRNQQSNSFRTQNVNPQLDREFQQQFNPGFQNSFQGPQLHRPMNGPSLHQQPQHQVGSSSNWASDFANLSLNAPQQSRVQQQQRSDWSAQFMTNPQQAQIQHQQQQLQQQQHLQQAGLYQPTFGQYHSMYDSSRVMDADTLVARATEHQELHKYERQFQENLESEFCKLEEQFNEPIHEIKQELPIPNPSNEQFKQAAKTISQAMSQSSEETSTKFANSEFLKLMNMVSTGKVTLNEEETKLVDSTGKDIHEEKLEEDNKLPDPLEGLNANDLISPFESAKKVGELHQEKYTWDDMYDDYRHDDDAF